jgi:hypothetical protein
VLGSKLRYREVSSDGMFGANSVTQQIGTGRAAAIDSLTIDWPVTKTRQVFRNVPIDSVLEIRELDDEFTVRSLKRFVLRGPGQDEYQH